MTRLTPHNLHRWLVSLPPDHRAGDVDDCYTCVVAEFLLAHGAAAPYMFSDCYTRDEFNDRLRPLPTWTQAFIFNLSGAPTVLVAAPGGGAFLETVSAREALAVLEQVTR